MAFVGGNACSLPFSDNSFDRVMAVECIFHFPSRRDFLREVKRVLRPGGCLVLSDFVPNPLFAPFGKLSKLEALRSINLLGDCDVSCTAGGYRRLAAETGFRVTTLRDITPNTLPTYAFLKHMVSAPHIGGRAGTNYTRPLIGLLDFYGRSGLLRYTLLRLENA
jgi:ubiquinone/menaquinone biosynthesis C-methylase UbiE